MYCVPHLRHLLLAPACQLLAAILLTCLAAEDARADKDRTPPFPHLAAVLSVELQNDAAINAAATGSRANTLFTTSELALDLFLTPSLKAHGSLTFEPVTTASHDLYLQQLYLDFAPTRGLHVFAGKFTPAFALAWDVAPGIYGADLAGDHETRERLGLGLQAALDTLLPGQASLTASLYAKDLSPLSRSLLGRRPAARLADGGAGNGKGLQNLSLALDITPFPNRPDLRWHLSWRYHHKGTGVDDVAAEYGLALGGLGQASLPPLLSGQELQWVWEYVHLENVSGTTRDTLDELTFGGLINFGHFHLAASVTARAHGRQDSTDAGELLATASMGRSLPAGWTLDFGVKCHLLEGQESWTAGLLLARSFKYHE